MDLPHEPCVVFSAAGEPFALPLSSVREVVRPGMPRRVPRAPFGCLGALELRGEPLPLVCLGVLLGLEAPARVADLVGRLLDAHVLVVLVEGAALALLVDRVLEVAAEVKSLTDEKHALGRAGTMVRGAVQWAGGRAWVLEPAALVGRGRRRLLSRAVQAPEAGPQG